MIQIRSAGKSDEVKSEQSLMYLAICVCTMEVLIRFFQLACKYFQTMYYVMYYYGFVMNANFQVDTVLNIFFENLACSAESRSNLRVLFSANGLILWCTAISVPSLFNAHQTRCWKNSVSNVEYCEE